MPSSAVSMRASLGTMQPGAGSIIRSKSPLRISFVGGGTDLPQYYEKYPGAVLSSTINRYAHVSAYPREDGIIEINSLDLGHNVQFNMEESPVFDGVMDLAKAAIKRMGLSQGVTLDIRMEAPRGSGLGGSSALTSAVLGALSALNGSFHTLYELAELNYEIERKDLAIAGGKQDQYATTFGGFNILEFHADRVSVTPLRIDRSVLNDLEAHLLLCYTGKIRPNLGLVDQQMKYFAEGRKDTLTGMHRMYEMVYEMKEALLTGALDRFGAMLHEAYVNKQMMNPHVADGTPADALYAAARKNGVIGGKLLGAGGGGYLLLFCETSKQAKVRLALEEMGGQFAEFSFDGLGIQVWRSCAL
jgi:D-glycero-alpha-D-manno-heptose-7-phosphate kinase